MDTFNPALVDSVSFRIGHHAALGCGSRTRPFAKASIPEVTCATSRERCRHGYVGCAKMRETERIGVTCAFRGQGLRMAFSNPNFAAAFNPGAPNRAACFAYSANLLLSRINAPDASGCNLPVDKCEISSGLISIVLHPKVPVA
jgi:hypothetical protein